MAGQHAAYITFPLTTPPSTHRHLSSTCQRPIGPCAGVLLPREARMQAWHHRPTQAADCHTSRHTLRWLLRVGACRNSTRLTSSVSLLRPRRAPGRVGGCARPRAALRTQGGGPAGGGARRAPGCVAGLISRTPRTRPRMRAAAASAYGPPPDAPARKMRRLGSSLSASASRSAAKLVSVRSGCGSLCASSAACSMFAGCCGLLQCCFVATLLQRCSANQDAWV